MRLIFVLINIVKQFRLSYEIIISFFNISMSKDILYKLRLIFCQQCLVPLFEYFQHIIIQILVQSYFFMNLVFKHIKTFISFFILILFYKLFSPSTSSWRLNIIFFLHFNILLYDYLTIWFCFLKYMENLLFENLFIIIV